MRISKVRAKKIGEVLAGLGEALRKRPDDLYTMKSRQIDLPADGVLRTFDDREVRDAVNLDGVFHVCDEIRMTKARLLELAQMKAKIGLA